MVNKNYEGDADGSITLHRGDLVEVLKTSANGNSNGNGYKSVQGLVSDKVITNNIYCRRPKMDSDLGDINMDSLLNSDAAKHRLSIKPKKNHLSSHQRSVSPQRPLPKPDEKYVNYKNYYLVHPLLHFITPRVSAVTF